ncbi:hypothetical protein EYC80_004142 [Monilinia laxa]|uniref:Uncharacterized protein n=1 Tax=Monilinia laxa TaxID=61186 RepID=A0A5N6KM78_MONLA|nr:hypothetical protein EYC80_004142 [Monilinia laxa]
MDYRTLHHTALPGTINFPSLPHSGIRSQKYPSQNARVSTHQRQEMTYDLISTRAQQSQQSDLHPQGVY